MLVEFWQAAFRKFLAPAMTAQSDMSAFHILGTVLSHGYVFCNVLPPRIAFPCLAAIFLGIYTKILHKIHLLVTYRLLSKSSLKNVLVYHLVASQKY